MEVGDKVSTSKLLAKRGTTGKGAGNGERPHLHLEASLNADDPFTTPSEPDEKRGNYQLIDPITVLNKTQYQTFTLNGEWTDASTGIYYNFVDEGTTVGDVVI